MCFYVKREKNTKLFPKMTLSHFSPLPSSLSSWKKNRKKKKRKWQTLVLHKISWLWKKKMYNFSNQESFRLAWLVSLPQICHNRALSQSSRALKETLLYYHGLRPISNRFSTSLRITRVQEPVGFFPPNISYTKKVCLDPCIFLGQHLQI